MVAAKYFEVAELSPQAQLVVRLELVSMAGSADRLEVFPTVWIAKSQAPDEACRHNGLHGAWPRPLPIHAAPSTEP